MKFSEYQEEAGKYAQYGNSAYPIFALVEEVGELFRLFAKNSRGDVGYEDNDKLDDMMKKELGDILWQLTHVAKELGTDLEAIAELNLSKLKDRAERNVIKGDGDNR